MIVGVIVTGLLFYAAIAFDSDKTAARALELETSGDTPVTEPDEGDSVVDGVSVAANDAPPANDAPKSSGGVSYGAAAAAVALGATAGFFSGPSTPEPEPPSVLSQAAQAVTGSSAGTVLAAGAVAAGGLALAYGLLSKSRSGKGKGWYGEFEDNDNEEKSDDEPAPAGKAGTPPPSTGGAGAKADARGGDGIDQSMGMINDTAGAQRASDAKAATAEAKADMNEKLDNLDSNSKEPSEEEEEDEPEEVEE